MTVRVMEHAGIVDILMFDPSYVNFIDISTALESMDRFAGQGQSFVSVAEHTVYVTQIMGHLIDAEEDPTRMIQLALLHDMHEAYVTDMITPVKKAISRLAGWDIINYLNAPIDKAIFSVAGVKLPNSIEKELVDKADQCAAYYEAHYLKLLDIELYNFPEDVISTVDALAKSPCLQPVNGSAAFNALVACYLPKLFQTGSAQ